MDPSLRAGDKVLYVGNKEFLKDSVGTIKMNDHSGVPYLVKFKDVTTHGEIEWWCMAEEVAELCADSPLTSQVGGNHYSGRKIQPIEYILANGLGFCEGNVVKYITRYKDKGGLEDLHKARHYIDFLIADMEEKNNAGDQ